MRPWIGADGAWCTDEAALAYRGHRPENLRQIGAAIGMLAGASGVDVVWHTQSDPERQSVGGQSIKMRCLTRSATAGSILDDDNLPHTNLFRAVAEIDRMLPDAAMIALTQEHRGGRVRPVHAGMLRASHVDAGQVVVRRDAIGDLRIPEHYQGMASGSRRWRKLDGRIVFVDTPATYYNWLRSECWYSASQP